MSNVYCVSGLVQKRAALAAELHDLTLRADQLRAGIAHLDSVLTNMERARSEEPRSRQYRPEWFGNLGRLVLGALRDAPEPMTSMRVVAKVMDLCGLETADKAMVGSTTNRGRFRLPWQVSSHPRRWPRGPGTTCERRP